MYLIIYLFGSKLLLIFTNPTYLRAQYKQKSAQQRS